MAQFISAISVALNIFCFIFLSIILFSFCFPPSHQMKEAEQAALLQQQAEMKKAIDEVIKSGMMENGKVEIKSQPMIVIEDIEPPYIPEMSMEEMIETPYTGDNAVRYLVRLLLRDQNGRIRRKRSGEKDSSDIETGFDNNPILSTDSDGTGEHNEHVNKASSGNLQEVGKLVASSEMETTQFNNGVENSKRKRKKKRKKKNLKPSALSLEEIQRSHLKELEMETREIIKEAAEALNRNQTPVVRRTPPKVYKVPSSGAARPIKTGKVTVDKKTSKRNNHTPKSTTPTKSYSETEDASIKDILECTYEGDVMPVPSDDEHTTADETLNIPEQTVNPLEAKTTPITYEMTLSTEEDELHTDNLLLNKTTLEELAPSISLETTSDTSTPMHEMRHHQMLKILEGVWESEVREISFGNSWPTLEECEEMPLPRKFVFSSTWLSVTTKGVE